MSIAGKFIEEVKIGYIINILLGAKEFTGTVTDIDADTVQIKTNEQKIKTIAISSISCYEIIETTCNTSESDTDDQKFISSDELKFIEELPDCLSLESKFHRDLSEFEKYWNKIFSNLDKLETSDSCKDNDSLLEIYNISKLYSKENAAQFDKILEKISKQEIETEADNYIVPSELINSGLNFARNKSEYRIFRNEAYSAYKETIEVCKEGDRLGSEIYTYKEYIENNNIFVSESFLRLYPIYLSQGKYDEIAHTLGGYCYGYIPDELYQQIKKLFFKVCPQYIKELIKNYEDIADEEKAQKSVENSFYYKLFNKPETYKFSPGRKYEELEFNPDVHIPNHIKHINGLIKNKQYDEAINYLDNKAKSKFSAHEFINQKFKVLLASGNEKHVNEITDIYNKLFNDQKNYLNTIIIANKIAYYYQKNNYFNEALNLYFKIKDFISNIIRQNESYYKILYFKICEHISYCCYRLNKPEQSLQFAHQMQTLDQNNETALDFLSENHDYYILNNLINSNELYALNEISLYNLIKKQLEESRSLWDVSLYHIEKCNNCKRNMNYAYQVYLKIERDSKINSMFNYKKYFLAANYFYDALVNEDEEDKNNISDIIKHQYFYESCIVKACYLMAVDYLRQLKTVTARFPLRQIFNQYLSNTNHQILYWALSNFLYLKTFFESGAEIQNSLEQTFCSFSEILNNHLKPIMDTRAGLLDKDYKIKLLNTLTDKINQLLKKKLITGINEFVIEMLQYLKANNNFKKTILRFMYMNPLRNKIINILSLIGTEVSPSVTNLNDFEKCWDKTSANYFKKTVELSDLITQASENLFVSDKLKEIIESLSNQNWKNILIPTDQNYLNDFIKYLKDINKYKYTANKNFYAKLKDLEETFNIRVQLLNHINQSPTLFSSEVLYIPISVQCPEKEDKEFEIFCGNSEPKISAQLSEHRIYNRNKNLLTVTLLLKNEKNRQTAEELIISVKTSTDDNSLNLEKFNLEGDGEFVAKKIEIKVNNCSAVSNSLNINVEITYKIPFSTELSDKSLVKRYETHDEFGEIVEYVKQEKYFFNVSILENNNFIEIENKFDTIRDGHPIKDDSMFFGRQKDIDAIINRIRQNDNIFSGSCTALYGQTRTGKTSVLFHVEKELRSKNPNYIIVNLGSLGDLNLKGNDINAFLYAILSKFEREVKRKHKEFYQLLKREEINTDPNQLLEKPDFSRSIFNKIFDECNELINSLDDNYKIILMIDEFTYIYDWIRKGEITNAIMKFWKALLQNYNIFALIIGQDHMMQFVNDPEFSNDFGTTDLRKITYLSKEYAKKLMDEPVRYKDNDGNYVSRFKDGSLDYLYDLTAGSAFLIAQLCAALVDYMNENHFSYISKYHVDDYLEKNMQNIEESRYFEPQYNDRSNITEQEAIVKNNKELLKKIALASDNLEWSYFSKLNLNDEEKQTLKKLEFRDVVIVEKNERCKIKVELYKKWLIYKYGK